MADKGLRAIDLYSGVGGWSLGLRLAGIEVVASYERWGAANETNFKNNKHPAQTVDIRGLSVGELPKDIDIVVGSPPCTQFSFSNRGGNGDLDDGLKDIVKFLEIVDAIRPSAWAMENVPRVASIIEEELKEGHRLHRFRHLGVKCHVINMADYGLPQRRKRCVAGNFDPKLLAAYAKGQKRRTLGHVLSALREETIRDPLYGATLPRADLKDHHPEPALNEEEVRVNRAAKVFHPVYNAMSFPDSPDRPVRTITATCTRVSRESIVVGPAGDCDEFRRLTIRERACLQGFPVWFQFYASSYGQKLKMVGNAIPPYFAYFVGAALRGLQPDELPSIENACAGLYGPQPDPPSTTPECAGTHYPKSRTFRFAIPSLRLKSGVRFELANAAAGEVMWQVAFVFGTSKSIHRLALDESVLARMLKRLPPHVADELLEELSILDDFIAEADVPNMQTIWSHRGPGRTRPFMLLDELDAVGLTAQRLLSPQEPLCRILVAEEAAHQHADALEKVAGLNKLANNATVIAAGLIVGSLANVALARHSAAAATLELKERSRPRR